MYPDFIGVCQFCFPECTSCSSAAICLTCSSGYYFVNMQCKLSCPAQYYPDSTNPNYLFCRNCPTGCTLCTNVTVCTACGGGLYLQSTYSGAIVSCQSTCNNGY